MRNRPVLQIAQMPKGASRRGALAASLGLGLGAFGIGKAHGLGPAALFRLVRLNLPDLPDPRPTAFSRLAIELERRTSLSVHTTPLALRAQDPELFGHPMLILNGDRGFALPPEKDLARLRRYLTYGGFLFVDSAEGRVAGAFDRSVRALMARLLPGDLPERVPDKHVFWKSFYLLQGRRMGRLIAAPHMEMVQRDRRMAILYTQNDMCGAMAKDGFGRWEHDVLPGGESQREMTFRFGVNLVMYALCLDYKEEQAHIDFILRKRRVTY